MAVWPQVPVRPLQRRREKSPRFLTRTSHGTPLFFRPKFCFSSAKRPLLLLQLSYVANRPCRLCRSVRPNAGSNLSLSSYGRAFAGPARRRRSWGKRRRGLPSLQPIAPSFPATCCAQPRPLPRPGPVARQTSALASPRTVPPLEQIGGQRRADCRLNRQSVGVPACA
jgi:hypothetical protein